MTYQDLLDKLQQMTKYQLQGNIVIKFQMSDEEFPVDDFIENNDEIFFEIWD